MKKPFIPFIPLTAGGQKIAVRFEVQTSRFNTVLITVSVPCRKGQRVKLIGVDESNFIFTYSKGDCLIQWYQDTSNISKQDLIADIKIWFRYSYYVNMDAGEYTSSELLRILG
jgi:hypothetical protein